MKSSRRWLFGGGGLALAAGGGLQALARTEAATARTDTQLQAYQKHAQSAESKQDRAMAVAGVGAALLGVQLVFELGTLRTADTQEADLVKTYQDSLTAKHELGVK